MEKQPGDLLTSVVEHCNCILDLARAGDHMGGDDRSHIVFGTLRDAAYKMREVAEQEISRRGARPAKQVGSGSNAAFTPAQAAQRELGHRKVLIVDDEADVVTYLQHWFEDRGFITSCAFDSADALAKIEAHRPDLVTLDMNMPDRSGEEPAGLELFRHMKDDPQLRDIPVIVITGLKVQKLLAGSRPDGPDGLLIKPIKQQDLATLVNRLVLHNKAAAPEPRML